MDDPAGEQSVTDQSNAGRAPVSDARLSEELDIDPQPQLVQEAEVSRDALGGEIESDALEGEGELLTSDVEALPPVLSSTMPSSQLDVIDSGGSSQFARLVRGWETYVHHGARNVQLGLQNLNLCGEGLARLGGPSGPGTGIDDEDLFAPIVLRHTHSSPLNYSRMFDDNNDPPPAAGFDHMRRSSSTPSTSVFRQRSAGSAFVANLRTVPNLSGPDDRSAFTLPMQRTSYASTSDSGVRFNSAFNPINFKVPTDDTENTSIEVLDMGPAEDKQQKIPPKWHAASKAKKFLQKNVLLRRRRRQGGQADPTGPSSASSKGDDQRRGGGDDDDDSSKPVSREVQVIATVQSIEEDVHDLIESQNTVFPLLREEEEDIILSPQTRSQYHHLDSDPDEEYTHYQRIEAIHESPGTVPSPSYQPFVDRGETPPTTGVRVQVSVRSPIQHVQSSLLNSMESSQVVIGRTMSQDSGAESPGTAMSTLTSNTSGHATLGTSTSGTVSSGRLTILSTVSETDREVMETNKAGRGLRLRQASQGNPKTDEGGDATVDSSSTASATTNGYLALDSPGPLRDGASLLTDRFFKASTIPVAHSSSVFSGSTNSGSTSSGTSGGSAASTTRVGTGTEPMQRLVSHLTASSVNPFGETASTMGNTTSSSSTQSEDPPKFVSYLDQITSDTGTTIVRGDTRSSPPVLVRARRDSTEGRESPAQIVDYSSQLIFEAAKPESQNVFRPVKRDRKQPLSRPPLSPIKGLRTPPPHQRPVSTSPAYQQLSPPNIVDHRVQSSDVSKPYVLRSAPPPQGGIVLITPERGGASNPAVPSDGRESSEDYLISSLSMDPSIERSRTYRETSIEVEKDESAKENPSAALVTPEASKRKS